jgi:hypothetical protein
MIVRTHTIHYGVSVHRYLLDQGGESEGSSPVSLVVYIFLYLYVWICMFILFSILAV